MPAKRENVLTSAPAKDEAEQVAKRQPHSARRAGKKPNYLQSEDEESEQEDVKAVAPKDGKPTRKPAKREASVRTPVD